MISVVITNAGRRRALEMQGHAGFSQKGEPDIVCAGCSAVVYALLGMDGEPSGTLPHGKPDAGFSGRGIPLRFGRRGLSGGV